MMHSNNFVAVIKAGGKVLREVNSIVHIPFGSEYTILLKNLNSVRAHCQVKIDGADATSGKVILPAHGTVELERFINNFNLNEGNKFKFIERTAQIEQHRGVGVEDGLVTIEFWKEIPQRMPVYYPPTGRRTSDSFNHPGRRGILRSSGISGQSMGQVTNSSMSSETSYFTEGSATMDWAGGAAAAAPSEPLAKNDAGITVQGSHSTQPFVIGEYFPVEMMSTVVTLHLKGAVGQQAVQQPITVDYRKECTTCGLKNSINVNFCARCGTSLNIL